MDKKVLAQVNALQADLYNANCYTMRDFTTSTYYASITNKTSTGCTLSLMTGVQCQGKFVVPNANLNVGDWCFVRLKIKSSVNAKITLLVFSSSGNYYYDKDYILTAGVEYEIYFRTGAMTTTGALNFYIQSNAPDSSSQILTILDLMITVNNEETWRDIDTRLTLKDFGTGELIVDINGNGHFYDINKACTYAKLAYDVVNKPVTIKVKNGYYLQTPTNTYPYATISKGVNKISIIGESKDGVIIECYNTSTTQSRIIDIGGQSSVENMTINCLNDGTYNAGNDLGHNCYGIHDDTNLGYTPSGQYRTTVKNCRVYSACHSPIGAGLRDHQIQRYENCEFVSDGFLSAGALYVHGSNDLTGTSMAVEIINCSCVSLDGTKAITLPDNPGALQYVNIPVTIQRTIGYTNGVNVTDASFKVAHELQPQSALNNVADWNY